MLCLPISLCSTYNGKLEELEIQLQYTIQYNIRLIGLDRMQALLLLPVPDNSAFQSYLSSCDVQCLSSLFLNELTEVAVTTKNGMLFHHTFVIRMMNTSEGCSDIYGVSE